MKRNSPFKSKLTRAIHISAELERLIWLAISFFISVHLIACFWGLIGLIGPEPAQSWVLVYGYMDESEFQFYLICVYWVITTLTTVGYGDIGPQNYAERIAAWMVMIFGVFVYSYIIGAVSGLVSSLNASKNQLNKKYEVLNKIAEKYNINPLFYRKIQKALDYEFKQDNKAYDDLLASLPIRMRNELLSIMYQQ